MQIHLQLIFFCLRALPPSLALGKQECLFDHIEEGEVEAEVTSTFIESPLFDSIEFLQDLPDEQLALFVYHVCVSFHF